METAVGNTAQALCSFGPPGLMVGRLCESRDMWARADDRDCRTIASAQFMSLVEKFDQVLQ